MVETSLTVTKFEDRMIGLFSLTSLAGRSLADGSSLLAHAKARKPAPKCILILDISGSMSENMEYLRSMSQAFVDHLPADASLAVIKFDDKASVIVSAQTRGDGFSIKQAILAGLVNENGMTNAYDALVLGLDTAKAMLAAAGPAGPSHEPVNIVFLTDGCTNVGAHVADLEILERVKAHDAFPSCVVHTIGFDDHGKTGNFNSLLLNELATESGGVFHVPTASEELAACVADLLSNYYMTTTSAKLSIRELVVDEEHPERAAASRPATVVSKASLNGFRVRMDEPTPVAFELPEGFDADKDAIDLCVSCERLGVTTKEVFSYTAYRPESATEAEAVVVEYLSALTANAIRVYYSAGAKVGAAASGAVGDGIRKLKRARHEHEPEAAPDPQHQLKDMKARIAKAGAVATEAGLATLKRLVALLDQAIDNDLNMSLLATVTSLSDHTQPLGVDLGREVSQAVGDLRDSMFQSTQAYE